MATFSKKQLLVIFLVFIIVFFIGTSPQGQAGLGVWADGLRDAVRNLLDRLSQFLGGG